MTVSFIRLRSLFGFLLLVTVWSIHGRVDEVLTLIGIMMGIWPMDFLFETFRPNNPRAGYYHKSAREKEKVWRRCYGKN
jgi:hypothetical protein